MKRKYNYAAYVNYNTPHLLCDRIHFVSILRTNHDNGRLPNRLDVTAYSGVVILISLASVSVSTMTTQDHSKPSKARALLEEGTLNRSPEKVSDPKFRDSEFFDARDIVQVKYEMLRRVIVESASVSYATQEYGVSRPTYYQAKASFDEAGIAGLVPKKRGPRGPHKLQGEVLAFVEQHVIAGQPIRARKLAMLVRQKFDLEVHPRTIERALGGKKTPR